MTWCVANHCHWRALVVGAGGVEERWVGAREPFVDGAGRVAIGVCCRGSGRSISGVRSGSSRLSCDRCGCLALTGIGSVACGVLAVVVAAAIIVDSSA